jgi:hypothetical protein
MNVFNGFIKEVRANGLAMNTFCSFKLYGEELENVAMAVMSEN